MGNKYLSISLKSILVRLNIVMSSWFGILHLLFCKVTLKVILFQIIPSIMSFWQENYAFIKVFFIALTKNDMAETWYPAKYLYTTSLCWLLILPSFYIKKKEKNPRVCAAGCVRQQEREDGGGDGQVREGNNWGKSLHFLALPIDNI